MSSSSRNIVEVHAFGPCLNCSQSIDLVRQEQLNSCFWLYFLPTRFDFSSMTRERQLACRHCGFSTDLCSYNSFRGQTIAGLISTSFDTSDSTLEDDVSEISTSLCLKIEQPIPPNGQEEYQSLVDLILKDHACLGCESPLASDWRFCPKCGTYVEIEAGPELIEESHGMHDSESDESSSMAGLADELD